MKNKIINLNTITEKCSICIHYDKQNNRKKNPLYCEFHCEELGKYKLNQYKQMFKKEIKNEK